MLIKLSESLAARRTIYFTAVENVGDTAYTGALTGADIRISKAGGAEADSLGTATHIATGLYKYEFTTGEVDTVGEISLRLAKTGVYNDVRVFNVVAFDPYAATNLGLTYIDESVGSRLATTDYEDLETMLDTASTIETGVSLRGMFRLLLAALAGKISGGGTTTITIRNAVADSKPRITATVDSSGNRTAITTDLT
jgi:hypothetical protein